MQQRQSSDQVPMSWHRLGIRKNSLLPELPEYLPSRSFKMGLYATFAFFALTGSAAHA